MVDNVNMLDVDSDYPELKVKIDGNVYTVPSISADTLSQIKDKFASIKDGEVDNADPHIVTEQLAFILGQDKATFAKTDMRKVAKTLKWLLQQFNGEDANSGKG